MSVRRVAAIVAGAVVAGGIVASLPWVERTRWSTPEEQYAEVVRLAGIPAKRVACELGAARRVGFDPSIMRKGEGVGLAWPVRTEAGGATPAAALAAHFTGSETRFPRLPYVQEPLPDDRVLFTYAFRGRVKIAVVVGPNPDEPGYRWLQYAQCNPAELSPSWDRAEIWSSENGNPVSADLIVGTPPVPDRADCAGAGVSFLWNDYGSQVYVRDPLGTYTGKTHGRYEAAAVLPADANPSHYRRAGVAVWWAVDQKSAYLVGPGGTERLFREKGAHRHCV